MPPGNLPETIVGETLATLPARPYLSAVKIVYDKEICQRHGQCVGAAPELFEFAPDGSLVVLNTNPPEELWEAAQDAVDVCPVQALTLEKE